MSVCVWPKQIREQWGKRREVDPISIYAFVFVFA